MKDNNRKSFSIHFPFAFCFVEIMIIFKGFKKKEKPIIKNFLIYSVEKPKIH